MNSPSLDGLFNHLPSIAVRTPYQPHRLIEHPRSLQAVLAIADARLWRLTTQPTML